MATQFSYRSYLFGVLFCRLVLVITSACVGLITDVIFQNGKSGAHHQVVLTAMELKASFFCLALNSCSDHVFDLSFVAVRVWN